MRRLNYTIFAQAPDGDYSTGVEVDLNLSESHYSLFAIDNAGLISDSISISMFYIANKYSIFSKDASSYSLPASASCIVSPINVPKNVRIIHKYTTHKTIKIEWNAIVNTSKYAVYIKNLETSEAWQFETLETNYVALNLKSNSPYEIRVASHVGYNFFSELSAPVVTSTLNAYFGEVLYDITTTSINLNWKPVMGASAYKIYYGIPGIILKAKYSIFGYTPLDEVSVPISLENIDYLGATVTDTSFFVDNLTIDRQYFFFLVAVDENDVPLTSTCLLVITLAIMPAVSDIFSYIIKEITTHSVTMAWSPAARAHYYRIHLNNNPKPYIDYIYQPEVKIMNLLSDTIYTITIVSVNTGGEAAAAPFTVRTAIGTNILSPQAPRLIYPNCGAIVMDQKPGMYWQLGSDGNTGLGNEFFVELADNVDFIAKQEVNSFHNKSGFSFDKAQKIKNKKNPEIVNYRPLKTFIKK